MKKYDLLPFEVIQAAAGGDIEAMSRVMRQYSGYIAKLSIRPFYDAAGNPHYAVDEDMRRQLEAKLTAAILRFKVA
jgi:hypothetical protein